MRKVNFSLMTNFFKEISKSADNAIKLLKKSETKEEVGSDVMTPIADEARVIERNILTLMKSFRDNNESSLLPSVRDFINEAKEDEGDQFGDEIKAINIWVKANHKDADDWNWSGKTLTITMKDDSKKTFSRADLAKEIESLNESKIHEGIDNKDFFKFSKKPTEPTDLKKAKEIREAFDDELSKAISNVMKKYGDHIGEGLCWAASRWYIEPTDKQRGSLEISIQIGLSSPNL